MRIEMKLVPVPDGHPTILFGGFREDGESITISMMRVEWLKLGSPETLVLRIRG